MYLISKKGDCKIDKDNVLSEFICFQTKLKLRFVQNGAESLFAQEVTPLQAGEGSKSVAGGNIV